MPRIKPEHKPIGTTPFPNILLDRVMPRLTDTQWRLLCVIVRQTFGWRDRNGDRKRADWLSHSQLKRRTGRHSAAISRAIDALVRSGLIRVRDSNNRSLRTSHSRRRSRSKLHFATAPINRSETVRMRLQLVQKRSSKSENNKRNLYKRKQQQLLPFSRAKPRELPSREKWRNG